ncbi:MAG: hypothetical protein IPF82_12555 [Blastocatellia bacterium]|nr:hypothetical protein [Blastocatellia bacterium]
MNTRTLLIASAAVELGAGLALVAWPSMPVSILLGAPLDTPVGFAIARLAGAALLSLAIACWLAREDGDSRAGRALVTAMLMYNLGAVAVLAHAGAGRGMSALVTWMAVVLHLAMTAWCAACLNRSRRVE